ncbi:MAG: hypothetical protein L0H95_03535, partial [Lactobacillus sp.]|uniref:hypothetical protein n=1 Tax=Lactobacillus sp. TaxID=1591 RepID=UPI00264813F8
NRKKKGLKAQFLPALKCGEELLNQSQSLSMNLVLIQRKPQNKIYARNKPSVIFFFIFPPITPYETNRKTSVKLRWL